MLELFKNIGSKCRGAVKDSQESTEADFWGVDGNGLGDRLVQIGMAARRSGIDAPGLGLMATGALFGAGVIGVVGLAFFACSGQDEAEIEEES
ncbi:MAG: hypothetical protein Q8P72_03210, partial [Candidatus Roizmanbacteria bacterium]|nr:hypothetical protein [Candidatus Roizmanbacteria bacterium]